MTESVGATKQVQLFHLPHVLVLHLNRFAWSGACQKISKPIAFDAQLKLKPHLLSDLCPERKTGAEYSLIATVSHHGRNSAGATSCHSSDRLFLAGGGVIVMACCGISVQHSWRLHIFVLMALASDEKYFKCSTSIQQLRTDNGF